MDNSDTAAAAKSPQSCPTLRPHRRRPTRLPCPRDSPGKNPGVGCHFLLQCMEVKSESEVAQSCPALSDPMDCSLPGSSIHGIFQARALEWVPLPSPTLTLFILKVMLGDFPGGPVVKPSPSLAEGTGSVPGRGEEIPRALGPKSQNVKWKQSCNKFNKDFKNGPHQKNL